MLPEEQRQVILLVGLEGMRYEEVAMVLDIPIGTVRSRLSRGRESLRRLMDIKAGGGRRTGCLGETEPALELTGRAGRGLTGEARKREPTLRGPRADIASSARNR